VRPLAGAAVVAMVLVSVVVLALAAPVFASNAHPSENEIETLLVCPTCHETLDESNSAVAQQMKTEIRKRISEGWTKQQILDEMVASFGPGVLSTPATHGFDLLAWALPIGGIGVGALALGGGAWYWTRQGRRGTGLDAGDEDDGMDPELERLVDDELARFDP
jgi:cytochrome c-type biogenesis protein CcmH/NrfF